MFYSLGVQKFILGGIMSDQNDQASPALQPQQPIVIRDPKFTPKLNEALAKAQAQFIQPEKNKEVEVKKWDEPSRTMKVLYKTNYADLKNVVEAFRPHISKHGLSWTQKTVQTQAGWRLVLTLRHESGEYDETSMPINLEQAPQQVGSQLTYLKRYQAAAYFGIAADDDDDGNAAHGNEATFADKGKKNSHAKQEPAQNKDRGGESPAKPPQQQSNPASNNVERKADASVSSPGNSPEQEPKKPEPEDYVMPIGSDQVKGKAIGMLDEKTLRGILSWTEVEAKKVPPTQSPSLLLEISSNVKAFLKSMGEEA